MARQKLLKELYSTIHQIHRLIEDSIPSKIDILKHDKSSAYKSTTTTAKNLLRRFARTENELHAT